MTLAEQAARESVGAIPRPAGDKEVVKVNAFERAMTLNTQLAPVFPYFGPGDLVACAATLRGRPGEEYGQFFHENSQEEVAYTFGSNLAMVPTGYLIVAPKFHGVNSFLKEPHNPEAFLFQIIIQRQSEADASPEEQREGIHIRCPECQEFLLRHTFSADPTKPEEHGGKEGDRYAVFPTVYEALAATEKFNSDEACARAASAATSVRRSRTIPGDGTTMFSYTARQLGPHGRCSPRLTKTRPPRGGRMITRARYQSAFDLAQEVGPWDERPVAPSFADPQVSMSRSRDPQPFFLICEKDTVVIQMTGAADVDLRYTGVRQTRLELGDMLYIPAGTPVPDRAARGIHPSAVQGHQRWEGRRGLVLPLVRHRTLAL